MKPLQKFARALALVAGLTGASTGILITACIGSAYAAAPTIAFSSKTTGFGAINTRAPGSAEYALIAFEPSDGTFDYSVPVIVTSSNANLISVSKLAVANPMGNYILAVPPNAPAGSATITASATVGGISYTRSRIFVITAPVAVPPPPPAPPAGTPTSGRASTPTLNADQSGCATIHYYDVGPGLSYTALRQLPWSQFKGCDTVRIFPKANNAPYNEMMLLSAGTNLAASAANKFMRVIGMPDPVSGALPIIDGGNATQLETLPGQSPRSLQYHDNNNPSRALYKLGLVMVGPQLGYNYNFGPAGYIDIENLDIRNSVYGAPFQDGKTGGSDTYHSFGTCLYVEAAAHLLVKNNILHNCGNGLFINSKNSTVLELSQDVLVEGNHIYNNSNPPIANVTNGFHEHNSYTEARDIIFQYNTFGDVRPGAFGDCLKDRSSGLIVRYNTFASNCGISLNLLDPTGGQALIYGDAGFAQTYVYGNLFDYAPAPGGSAMLAFYGGDSGATAGYRQGTLHFYNNTVVIKGDATHGIYPEAFLFDMSLPNASVDARNNVFYTYPSTPGAAGKIQTMTFGKGTVNLANNWVSPNATMYWVGHITGAVVNGWNTNLGSNKNPGLMNPAQHDYRPAAGSPLINAGNGLANISTIYLPTAQPGANKVRKQDWMLDIGAFEY